MMLIGEDPRKHINDFSNQFQRDFLQLLRTSHGEKKVSCSRIILDGTVLTVGFL